jgi:hypothetical protein
MRNRIPQTIDMTPSGEFAAPPARPAWPLKIGIGAAVVAAVAGAVVVASLFLWLATLLLPLAVLAGLVAYGAFRFQLWRVRK